MLGGLLSGRRLPCEIASPEEPGETGDRYFCTNHAGVIFYTKAGSFSMNSTDCAIPTNAIPVGR